MNNTSPIPVDPSPSAIETSVPLRLCGSSAPLRREILPSISPVTGSAPVIDFTSSDQSLDRYHEIIVATGWRLDNYRKNPVLQNAHQYGDILFTIGRATITEVRGDRLYQRVEFATDINPMARIAYGLYKGGFLNAVSVGFTPIRWEDGAEKSNFNRRFLEQELLEVSAVGIPANPNALQLGLRDGAIHKSDLREVLALLYCSNPDDCSHRREEVADLPPPPFSNRSHRREEVADLSLGHILATVQTIRTLLRA